MACTKCINKATANQEELHITASRHGHLDCLKEALGTSPKKLMIYQALSNAIEEGHTNTSLYIIARYGCDREGFYDLAARKENIPVLEALLYCKCPISPRACYEIAETGSLITLKWLHEHGFPMDENVYIHGIISHNIDILYYAHEHHCPFSNSVYNAAITLNAKPQVLAFLKEIGCHGDW